MLFWVSGAIFPRNFRDEFEVVITQLLCSDSLPNRQLGLEILQEAYHESIISENNYINILRKISLSLIESKPAPDDSIIQQLNEVTKNKQRVITSEMLPGFIEYLRQLISPQIPANYRQQILSHLSASVGIPLDILQAVIPELVGYAEQEGNQNVRISIEECLLSLRAHNRPLDRDLWEDLYRYVRATLASFEEVQKERGNELSNRMRQITIEAKKVAGITEPYDKESEA